MKLNLNLLDQIYFLNIGLYNGEDTYFDYKTPKYQKNEYFDIKMARNAPEKDIFYCINKIDVKLVYYIYKDTVFVIGCNSEIQSLLIEALMEYLIKQFYEMYDESLLMTCYGEACHIFNGFSSVVIDTFKNYEDLDLIKVALVTCKGCKKTLKIIIKKSLIENTDKRTIPIVYIHSGHATLVYIDHDYKVRGHEIVSVSH